MEGSGFHFFSKGISPKVNVVAGLVFELGYEDVTVQHISHEAYIFGFDEFKNQKQFVRNK